jgi:predicted glycoside hydrolase/deacetylase ChbG (UPF0249 family)
LVFVNLAERLGYGPNDRVLVLNADDIGSSHAANEAAFECIEHGSLTSGSILVPAAWAPEAYAFAREHPEADLGLHLTLNSEYGACRWRPVASRTEAPGLYDDEGYLWYTLVQAVEHVSSSEAERELRAQIEEALAAGVDITHLDTHMGTVLQPKFIEAFVSLGLEYQIPLFIFRRNPDRMRRAGLGELWEAIDGQLQRLDEAGFPVLDHMIANTLDRPPETKETYFKELFADLRPGLTHFLVHPAKLSAETEALGRDAPMRHKDYELFRDGSMAGYLDSLGIKTTTYRAIREAYRSGALKN